MTWEEWTKYYRDLKREFWICVSSAVLIIAMPFLICCGGSKSEQAVQQTVFEQAVTEYETLTGKKIYPSGREFLRKAAEQKGLNTKSDIIDLIKYNEKFMWK